MIKIYLNEISVSNSIGNIHNAMAAQGVPFSIAEIGTINALIVAWKAYLSHNADGKISVTKEVFDKLDLPSLDLLITQTDEKLTLTLIKRE